MSARARELDQFYTSRPIARTCYEFLNSSVELKDTDWFLEPSAGDGAFYELMPTDRRMGVDIEPMAAGVEPGNFLQDFHVPAGPTRWITVGNPPFGKNASLAVAFFNHAAKFSEVVAFIVPLTFRKRSLQKRLDPLFHLVAELQLDELAFVFKGQPYSVPCSFQVWRRTATPRDLTQSALTHSDFEFSGPAGAHFAVRRVGGLAGKVIQDFNGYSPASHYFIHSRISPRRLQKRFEAIDWSDCKWNTAGNPSISKRELVAKYELIAKRT